LVRAENGYHLWSQTYDRKIDDIFKIQDEIASSVVNALKVPLLTGGFPKAIKTTNVDAYALYLQARSIYLRWTRASIHGVVEMLQKAISIDASFAPSWALLSRAQSVEAQEALVPIKQGYENARNAARQAMTLDPNLPEAHIALAKILMQYDWDWSECQMQIQEALRLEPGDSSALA
jgi:adenylate cyclase